MDSEELHVLRNLLAKPFENESEVVHFLVEIRKLIDSLDGERYPVLEFFCDWIVHHELTRKGAKQILSKFDQFVELAREQGGATKALMDVEQPLISLTRFENDLFLILGEHGLDTELIGDLKRLGPFLNLYLDSISRTPLKAEAAKLGLKNINNISVRKMTESLGPPGDSGDYFAFGIEWAFRKDDVVVVEIRNEKWFPSNPQRYTKTVIKMVNEGGVMKKVPLESKDFWDLS